MSAANRTKGKASEREMAALMRDLTTCSVVETEAESEIEARERVLHQHRQDLAVLEKLKRALRAERSRERYREKVGQDKQNQCTASTGTSSAAGSKRIKPTSPQSVDCTLGAPSNPA